MEEPRRTLDTYGPGEMSIPEWRLLQKVGGDWAKGQGAEPGQFYNGILNEATEELNIIVVDILSGRSRWGAEITSSGPVCFSMDAKSSKSANGTDCSKCEYRLDTPWSVDASERRKMCCLNYTVLGIDLDHDNMPVILRAHGVSALPVRQLIAQLRMNRSLKGAYHKAVINIKSQEKDTPYGETYTLRPKLTRLITDEVEAEELRVESQRLLGAPIPLPEGRPEEELEPLGFTPLGTPFYSEEEGDTIMAREAKAMPTATQIKEPISETVAGKEQPMEKQLPTEEKVEEKVEEKNEPVGEKPKLDMDF